MTKSATPIHPLGTRAKILLSSVFGPYAQNDAYGSREINPMELYQNQVTRVQGPYSLRMFHRSFGLMMIQDNIDAPCTHLDFPTLDRFIYEIKHHSYDIVGISSIIPNLDKVKKMCRLVRKHLPKAVIVVGGHVANKEDIHDVIDADHIVKGEGISWFRRFLGQNPAAAVRHPAVYSAFGARIVGVALKDKPGNTAAILIPSVGCPVGCNFCSTSALFGGKGKHINFYETGDELFNVMCQLEAKLKVRSFFVLDENFLLHRKRALRLLELMVTNNKSWSLSVFSSARVLASYTIEQLVRLGICWIWMGLEGKNSRYRKLNGVDTRALVRLLQEHGIRVLGSTIIGLEDHTSANIDRVIDYAVSHDTDFHQFMLYTPIPGTPLYKQHTDNGTLLSETDLPAADSHGQYRFNYQHPNIHNGREEQYILSAFQRDFDANGPSLARLIRTLLKGWQKYKNHPDKCIRNRLAWEIKPLRTTYAGAVWAMKYWYRRNPRMAAKMDALLKDIYQEFGLKTRAVAPLIGLYGYTAIRLEEKRLANGWKYEPSTFYEKNAAALAIKSSVSIASKTKASRKLVLTCRPKPAYGIKGTN